MAIVPSTRVEYTGDGVTSLFAISFPYEVQADVYATVNGVITPFTFSTPSIISIVPAPANLSEVVVYRDTPALNIKYVFASGVPFLTKFADTNWRQLLYVFQEFVNSTILNTFNLTKALRTPDVLTELPDAITRANKLVGFDAAGQPVALLYSDSSVPGLDARLTTAESSISVINSGRINTVPTFLSLLTTPATVGQVVHTAGHTLSGIGALSFLAVAGSVISDGGLQINSATAGIYWKAINYTELSTAFFGAIGDNSTNDTAACQAAINACPAYRDLKIYGRSVITAPLVVAQDHITIKGPGLIRAQSGISFGDLVTITNKTGVTIKDLDFDANKTGRIGVGVQNTRYMGLNFAVCTDCSVINCSVAGTRGFAGVSAVAIAMAGGSIRGTVNKCRLYNCGDAGFDSDGVFSSGEQNVISNSQAINCTDVGFVIESSNYSVISSCTTLNCAGGAAITNSTSTDKRGNIIAGLTMTNWDGASTGGIQIGVPGAGALFAGNLLDSTVSDVTAYADSSHGNGAAINVRQLGSGRVIGLKLADININGSKNQGILVDGDDVQISDPKIKNTTDACIQFLTGTTNGAVDGGKLVGGTYGITSIGTADISVIGVKLVGQSQNGLYAFNSSNIESRWNRISGAGVSSYGNDAGATISAGMEDRRIILTYGATISTNAALGNYFIINANNAAAFNFAAPTNPKDGQTITYRVSNISGGALGAVTFNAIFKMPAYAAPASGFSRAISFVYSLTTGTWEEKSRTPSDVPN